MLCRAVQRLLKVVQLKHVLWNLGKYQLYRYSNYDVSKESSDLKLDFLYSEFTLPLKLHLNSRFTGSGNIIKYMKPLQRNLTITINSSEIFSAANQLVFPFNKNS